MMAGAIYFHHHPDSLFFSYHPDRRCFYHSLCLSLYALRKFSASSGFNPRFQMCSSFATPLVNRSEFIRKTGKFIQMSKYRMRYLHSIRIMLKSGADEFEYRYRLMVLNLSGKLTSMLPLILSPFSIKTSTIEAEVENFETVSNII